MSERDIACERAREGEREREREKERERERANERERARERDVYVHGVHVNTPRCRSQQPLVGPVCGLITAPVHTAF